MEVQKLIDLPWSLISFPANDRVVSESTGDKLLAARSHFITFLRNNRFKAPNFKYFEIY